MIDVAGQAGTGRHRLERHAAIDGRDGRGKVIAQGSGNPVVSSMTFGVMSGFFWKRLRSKLTLPSP
jgi:hypothetical protein